MNSAYSQELATLAGAAEANLDLAQTTPSLLSAAFAISDQPRSGILVLFGSEVIGFTASLTST
jgi:hypothetical protein